MLLVLMAPVDPAVAAAPPPTAPARVRPANLLVLTSLVLTMFLGGAMQMWRAWPGLVGTELFCILLPAWLFARSTGAPKAALRLTWVGAAPCAWGLGIGAGLIPVAAAAGWMGEKILGYPFSLPARYLPQGPGAMAMYVVASVAAAPFCEEMLFRGYILGAYERLGWTLRRTTIVIAALFTMFHLSPARAPGAGVLALALTYVAMRTGSVWPPMAAHAGANGTAAMVVLLRPSLLDSRAPGPLIFIWIPAAVLALFCLRRVERLPARHLESGVVEGGAWWPLVVAATMVLLMAAAEILIQRK